MKIILLILLLLPPVAPTDPGQVAPGGANEQSKKTLVERLGYTPDTKLLIIHADDLGMAHSVNAASIKAFENGAISSASIMVPCPWFAEIAEYARSHPESDLGLHLTLTSEWKYYRWGPVLSRDRVATLLDRNNYLHPTEAEAASRADLREVESEIRAQIARAKEFGIQPTHLDSHMGTLYQNKALFEVLLRVGRENKLPVMISRDLIAGVQNLSSVIGPDDPVIDRIISIGPGVPPEKWEDYYAKAIKGLQPGVTEMIIHLAYNDDEMRAATIDHPDWGAGWRQRDFDVFTSEKFRQLLRDNNVKLITWREVGKLIAKPER